MEKFDEASEEIRIRRKKRAIKVFITESLMVIAVFALVIVTTLLATGYNVRPSEDGLIERTGLVQIQTMPTGANVRIDGEDIFGWTNFSRSMTEGEHEIVLSRDGYETWSKTIKVSAGLYYRLSYPRLFLKNRTSESLFKLGNDEKISFAKDGNTALVYSSQKNDWRILEINNEEVKTKDFDVSEFFDGVTDENKKDLALATRLEKNLEIVAWSGNSERVLMKNKNEWLIIDLKDLKDSVNLSKDFELTFSDVKIANDSASELYVVADGNLRKVDVNDEKISSAFVHNVRDFSNLKSDLVYVADDNSDGEFEVGVFRGGEKKGSEISINFGEIVLDDGSKKNAEVKKLSFSEYFGDYYVSFITSNNEWQIYRFSDLKKSVDDGEFTRIYSEKVDDVKNIEIRGGGELIVANFNNSMNVFDIEAEQVATVSKLEKNGWLDEHMIYFVSDGELKVSDFDGANFHEMTDDFLEDAEVKISKNNRYMYYVSKSNKLSRIKIMD